MLHCGHTVCEECTESLRDRHTSYIAIRCPTCRQFTSRMSAQTCNTNFQLMGYLAEKEKQERERTARGEKSKREEQHLQLKLGRSNKMEIHVAAKKDLNGTEMYLRKDSEGTTHVVIAGKTGTPEEILKFVDDHGLSIETGKLTAQMVHDEGRGREEERFVKVNNLGAGQSAIKCAKAPAKLEEAVFKESYELKATEENGSIRLELFRKGEPPKNGFGVFAGCMAKPTAKRLKEFTASTSEPSTSSASAQAAVEEPASKRRRCRK